MTDTQEQATPIAADLDAKVAHLSYEEARAKLVEIVSRLEQGNTELEESVTLWELGEALARRCETCLAGAQERLAAAQEQTARLVQTDGLKNTSGLPLSGESQTTAESNR